MERRWRTAPVCPLLPCSAVVEFFASQWRMTIGTQVEQVSSQVLIQPLRKQNWSASSRVEAHQSMQWPQRASLLIGRDLFRLCPLPQFFLIGRCSGC